MTETHSLTTMPNHAPNRPAGSHAAAPHPGRAIAARRASLNLKQEDVEARAPLLTQSLQSRIENNKGGGAEKRLSELPIVWAYLEALEWTAEQFSEETGIDVPVAYATLGTEAYSPTTTIAIFPTLAGPAGGEVIGQFPLDAALLPIPPKRPLEVRTLSSNDAVTARAQEHADLGDKFVVEIGARPKPGNLVIAFAEAINTWVAFKHTDDTPLDVAQTLDPSGPVFRLGQHDLHIDGVVRLVLHTP